MKQELDHRQKRLDEFDKPSVVSPKARAKPSPTDVERARRKFGPCTRFGEGDGTYWDRWLIAAPPAKSKTLGSNVLPQRGYKSLYPQRFGVPTKLLQVEKKKEEDAEAHESLTDLLASHVMDLVDTRKLQKQVLDEKVAAAIDFESAAPGSVSGSRPGSHHSIGSNNSSHPNGASTIGGRSTGLLRRAGECQTDQAKSAIRRFERLVDRSTDSLTSECTLPPADNDRK